MINVLKIFPSIVDDKTHNAMLMLLLIAL